MVKVVDTAISAGWIIPVDSEDPRVFENHTLLIVNERIDEILPTDDFEARVDSNCLRVKEHVVLHSHALIPGMSHVLPSEAHSSIRAGHLSINGCAMSRRRGRLTDRSFESCAEQAS